MMVNTLINGKYELLLPEHRAARPEWSLSNGGWEVARIDSMISAINEFQASSAGNKKAIVFDVGCEESDITAILAKYTGCDIVMFEPNERVFPCIKAIWEGNGLKAPLDFFRGFLSDKQSETFYSHLGFNAPPFTDAIISDHGFKQLYESYPDVPQTTLDAYCQRTGIYPDVITCDIEGAEWNLIKGAEKTLREKKPIIFMSIHPEFLYESYRNEGIWKERYGERCFVVHMLRFIDELGYKHECIEYDYHELHLKFIPC